MRKLTLAVLTTLLGVCGSSHAQNELTGDTRLACEALLCLASGTRPAECAPSLSRYFSIRFKKFGDTLKGRLNFLNLCPASNQTPQMSSLVSAVTYGVGRCDAESLNLTLVVGGQDDGPTFISDQMPDYCTAYFSNAYTRVTAPRYVGTPTKAGYWVEAADYERALAEYNARQQAEQQPPAGNYWWR